MSYYCPKCGKTFEELYSAEMGIRCPYCGNKIIFKLRPPTVKVVKAR